MRRFDVLDLGGALTAHMSIVAALIDEPAALDAAAGEHQINEALQSGGQVAHAANGDHDRTLEPQYELRDGIEFIVGNS
jgi:hypothetical protein